MIYDASWVAPWRTTEVRACRAEDCQSKPPHLVLACTLQDGLCRPCAEKRHVGRTEESQRPVQLELL